MILSAALALVLADTPEGALKDFAAALNRKDVPAAVKLIDGADPKADRRPITQYITNTKGFNIELGPIRREGKRLFTDVKFISLSPEPMKVEGDTIDVVQRGEEWFLVPGSSMSDNKSILGALTAALKDDSLARQAAVVSKKTQALSNLKQIAIGTILLANDNKEVFTLNGKNARTAISPYIKNNSLFKDPGTGRNDVYTFNALLANVSMNTVKSPAETVMWSIGPKGSLLFPYGEKNQTLIAYVDGHIKMVGREAAAKLRWKP
ncbi:hypothetical protein EON81_06680 [bacterium]|nr:MAG: hypothetical protein EON81_06680 [bacterium]